MYHLFELNKKNLEKCYFYTHLWYFDTNDMEFGIWCENIK